MERDFVIEWPDESGPMWMNEFNLLLCLKSYCPNTQFFVKGITEERKEVVDHMIEVRCA